ncbi:MAG: DUF1194 domain-containing protein [Pseudomonadota bacterium]
MRRALLAGAFAAAAQAAAPSTAGAEPCSLAIALALDISSSVNAAEYQIQKGGLAAALRHPDVRRAILASPGVVKMIVYEWSGWQQQDVIVGWTSLSEPADIDALADQVDRHQRRYAEFSTALGEALEFGASLFDRLPQPCARKVIDVSGDGVTNQGPSPLPLRLTPAFRGLTVNGLVIKGASPDPEAHYRREVISGPGAFLVVARNGFEDYPDLIIGKLVREIEPPVYIGAAEPAPGERDEETTVR